jgi:choice-of-anchor B domain-containing protein
MMLLKPMLFLLLLGEFISNPIYAQVYNRDNINLLSQWDDANASTGVAGNRYSGCYGYEAAGRQYAIVGAADGTFFIDITNPLSPIVRDYVVGVRAACTWREVHTYGKYAYIVSDDAAPNALQIIDLSYLPDSVKIVHQSDSIITRSHTLYIDRGHLYTSSVKYNALSSSSLAVWDVSTNPERPILLRKLDDDIPTTIIGNVHDAISYNDTIFASVGYQGIFILYYDATKNKFSILGSYSNYEGGGAYNHNAALLEDKSTLVFTDEVPKDLDAKAIDVSDYSDINPICTFHSAFGGTPHNIYSAGFGSRVILSYYQDGIWIYDFTQREQPIITGYFDTHYQTVGNNHNYSNPGGAYKGNWGAYLFPSNKRLIALDMQNGLFVLNADTALGLVTTPVDANKISINPYIFPNPVGNSLHIRIDEIGEFVYEIIAPAGNIWQRGYYNTDIPIDVAMLPKGKYFIKLSKDSEMYMLKFIKG